MEIELSNLKRQGFGGLNNQTNFEEGVDYYI